MACGICGAETGQGARCTRCGFPELGEAHARLMADSMDLLGKGLADRAARSLQQILRENRESWLAHLRLAVLYERKVEAGEDAFRRLADREYGEALRLGPAERDVHVARIGYAAKTGGLAQVKEEFRDKWKEVPFADECLRMMEGLEKSASLPPPVEPPGNRSLKMKMFIAAASLTALGGIMEFALVLRRSLGEEEYAMMKSMDFFWCVVFVTATAILVMEALRAKGVLKKK